MKTARIVGVLALAVLGLVYGVAMPRTRLRAEGPKPTRVNVQISSPGKVPTDPFSHATPRDANAPLQQKFIELMKIKAERMSEEELKAATSELQGTLAAQDREAEAALQEAVVKLREVVKNHQGTMSAEKARKAIVLMGFIPDEQPDPILDGADDFKSAPRNLPPIPDPARDLNVR